MRTLVLVLTILGSFQTSALELVLRSPTSVLVNGDLTIDPQGKNIKVSAPWTLQGLQLINTSPDEARILFFEVIAKCKTSDALSLAALYSADHDLENFHPTISAMGAEINLDRFYIYDLPACATSEYMFSVTTISERINNGHSTGIDSDEVTFDAQ